MLQVEHLTLMHRKDFVTLAEDISFALQQGERMALIGEEGNGKSTLLRVLAGDPPPYVEVSGHVVNTWRTGFLPQELPADERELSAYLFFAQGPSFDSMTPKELGRLAARLSLPADVFYSDQRMGDFSGGERVKLQLARLLMEEPELLLLDEPSNDLDADTVRWLEEFLSECGLTLLFVSHDEMLLRRVATGVILLERLRRRQVPRASVCRQAYEDFTASRADLFVRQEQVARKEREEYEKKMEKFEMIRRRVERDQANISRQNPGGGRLLKKKMHTVLSMGRRFDREAQEMTQMPEQEEAIFAKLSCEPLPAVKTVLALDLPELSIGDRVLSRNIRLTVRGQEKVCILGKNGVGKSTLLRHIRQELASREDLRVFYMPQDPGELLDRYATPVDAMTITGEKEENVRIRIALGSMKFTAEEMTHPCSALSGGQKAKLMFLMMAMSGANVLLLDEPTRNLSPLSGPVVRMLFQEYPGCMIAVSHDALFNQEVCPRNVTLTADGF